MKISIVSGGFDPLHTGHLDYLQDAKNHGDILIVALNSDKWLSRKKGKYFLPSKERKAILLSLKMVDEVIEFDDSDNSCCSALELIKNSYPNDEIIFCNGGDRNIANILEKKVEGINFKFGIGGNYKKNSSSWILKDYFFSSEKRIWGKFHTLLKDEVIKVKELIITAGKGMSYQRHFKRNEFWFVSKGKCKLRYSEDDHENFDENVLYSNDIFHVPLKSWHQLYNPYDEDCHIIEIQYGETTDESDIERLRFYENN